MRLGARTYKLHLCPCGKMVDSRGLYGLSCRKSVSRQQRHSQLNDIIWCTVKKAQIPASKEPVGLLCSDGKRLDGATFISWARRKVLAWVVTVPNTFAQSHIEITSSFFLTGTVANHVAIFKTSKYDAITSTHIFTPTATETAGSWNVQTIEFIQELGRRMTEATNEPQETQYLFKRLL